jgi:CubicO group peptidase (beta-lactamase class C family)
MTLLGCRARRFGLALALPLVARTAHAQAARITTDELLARLGTLADSLARTDALSGVILLAKDGRPVFEHAYGFADRDAKQANSIGTSFNLSSIGKRFTQVAIDQLQASGKLNLDSTIASAWPDYPNRDVARQVTIRQLLEHRSGIGGNIFQQLPTLRRNSDYLPLFVNEPLHFAPGTREEYSNAGYVVLGEIVARASGEDYYEYVRRHVFDPAAMTSAGFFARDSLPALAAHGYTRKVRDGAASSPSAPLARAEELQPRRGSAAGGSYASARDLLKFVLAHRNGGLGLPVDSRREIIAGGSPGSNGVVAEGLPGGYDLIVLENLDPPAADAIVAPVMSWLGAAGPPAGQRIMAGGAARLIAGVAAKLPNTPAGRVAADYLRAYNSGDAETVRRFFEAEAVSDSARPTAARVERYKTFFADNGRLDLVSVDAATPTSLSVSVNAARGGSISMTFEVEATGSNRLTSLQLSVSR